MVVGVSPEDKCRFGGRFFLYAGPYLALLRPGGMRWMRQLRRSSCSRPRRLVYPVTFVDRADASPARESTPHNDSRWVIAGSPTGGRSQLADLLRKKRVSDAPGGARPWAPAVWSDRHTTQGCWRPWRTTLDETREQSTFSWEPRPAH